MQQRRRLANTDILISPLGLGTVKFGRNQGVHYPQAFSLPSDAELADLLATAQSLGINFLDTAPAYGESETRLGSLLKNRRHEWVISTKVGETFTAGQSYFDFSPTAIRQSIERSLQRLHTDYLDMVLIHSNGEDQRLIEGERVFDTLAELKQAGSIRAFGMSTKTVEGGRLAVEQSDVVMITFNPVQQIERAVIKHAQALSKGVLIKKALASGHLNKIAEKNPVRHALEFIFQEPGVTSVVLGTINTEHLQRNVNHYVEFASSQ